MLLEPLQTTLAEGVPLNEVTFVVVDLETTGGSPLDHAITEIGAVTMRAGERLGSFQSLVAPGQPIPAAIAHLTGIDDLLVSDAPPIHLVLPTFVEFARGAVFVGHNASFDFGFLNVNLLRLDYEPLVGPPVCTARLARRVVWPDVPNVRLRTLARYFRTRATPVHRALADAEATAEVLHGLLELGQRLGIATLGDLREACTARGRPNFGKIRLTEGLPRAPGVYLFEGRDGTVLYVGKAVDLRARVRSYFYGDERKKVQDLLDAVATVRAIPTAAGEAEALVLEARLIAQHQPHFNSWGKRWRRYAYLKLDPTEAWPRLKVVRGAPAADDGCLYLGPFGSSSIAREAKDALEDVFPIRRCTRAMAARTRFAACALADMGRCLAPCVGRTSPERYGELVGSLADSLSSPGGLLAALEARMLALADDERFEEAALARDRLRAIAESLWRHRVDGWLTAGRLVLRGPVGERLEIHRGALARSGDRIPEPIGSPAPRERADELAALRSWVCRRQTRVEACDVPPSEPVDGGATLSRILRMMRESGRAERRR
jgi:DNA polymerase-3 subunit epsilon